METEIRGLDPGVRMKDLRLNEIRCLDPGVMMKDLRLKYVVWTPVLG